MGLIKLVGEELLQGFLMLLDEGFVLTLLALAILSGCHAQEFAKTIVGGGVEMFPITPLLQLLGDGLEEGGQETEGFLTALELGISLIAQELDDLGKTCLLLSEETISGGGSIRLLQSQGVGGVELARLYLLPPLLYLFLDGGFLDEGTRETEIVFGILIDGLGDAHRTSGFEEGMMLGIEVGYRLLQCQRHIAACHRTFLREDGGFLAPAIQASEDLHIFHLIHQQGIELFLHLTIIKGVTYLGWLLVGDLHIGILGDIGECQGGIAQAIDQLVIALDLEQSAFETGKLTAEDAYLFLFQEITVGLAKHHHVLLHEGEIILEEAYLILGDDDGTLVDIGIEFAAHRRIVEPLLQQRQGGLHEDQAGDDRGMKHLRLARSLIGESLIAQRQKGLERRAIFTPP